MSREQQFATERERELYEALRALHDGIADYDQSTFHDAVMKRARAALAKAEGQS